jgi:hypothetical protein
MVEKEWFLFFVLIFVILPLVSLSLCIVSNFSEDWTWNFKFIIQKQDVIVSVENEVISENRQKNLPGTSIPSKFHD